MGSLSLALIKKIDRVREGLQELSDTQESTVFQAPVGKCSVTKIYVNPNTQKIEIEYNDIPVS
jgi:hypothetical protein